MKKLLERLKNIFFPPAETARWLRILPFAILGVLTIIAFVGGNIVWEYSNSSEFCGTTCHTMPPQYSAYLASPHARVQCVECHIGRDVFTTKFSRKAGDLRHVVLNITKNYEYPITAKNMRPATDSCETCHFPEKFSDDSLRQIRSYLQDEANTQQDIYLLMKTGGGTAREGLGRGIHWHIENQVLYLALDEDEQEIPYIRSVDDEGNVTEYYDISSGVDPEAVAGKVLREMDCITCHNRITHEVSQPEDAISLAFQKGLIATDLPYMNQQAILLLRGEYTEKEEALKALEGLAQFYEENYPDLAADRSEDIQTAIKILQDIYEQSVFPHQLFDWDTHENNLGHEKDPGCFRCHDGKHLTNEGEAIRLECNVCHSIPVVGDPTGLTTEIEIVSGPEPFSHTLTNWMTLHGKAKDNTCTGCHTTPEGYEDLAKLEGKPPADNSFCGNQACHAPVWEYTGFNAPELEPFLAASLDNLKNVSPFLLEGTTRNYEETFNAIFAGRCAACHTGENAMAGLELNSYATILAGGANGPGIAPGDPDASVIYQRQSEKDHYGQMLDDEIEALLEWILDGAQE